MAYRRKRSNRRRKRGKHLSKFMVRAIKAVTKQEIETKHWVYSSNLASALLNGGYVPGQPAVAFYGNIYSPIARGEDPSIRDTSHQVFGQEFDSRGFKFMVDLWSVQSFVPAASNALDIRFRFTVFKQSGYSSIVLGNLPPGSATFDQDLLTTPTVARWDPDTVVVVYQKSFYMNYDGGANAMVKRSFWVPLKGKRTCTNEESSSAGTVSQLLGWQYYWALEIFSPGNTTLTTTLEGQLQHKIYFKDG